MQGQSGLLQDQVQAMASLSLWWSVSLDAALLFTQVADFGLSKQKQQTYVSGVSSSRGTLPWIAPEIIKSPDAVTEKVLALRWRFLLPQHHSRRLQLCHQGSNSIYL